MAQEHGTENGHVSEIVNLTVIKGLMQTRKTIYSHSLIHLANL